MHRSRLRHNDEIICTRTGIDHTISIATNEFLAQGRFLIHEINIWQVNSLKRVLERFYGKDPLESADLSRIVNSKHFQRLTELVAEKKVADKIVYGGQTDEKKL